MPECLFISSLSWIRHSPSLCINFSLTSGHRQCHTPPSATKLFNSGPPVLISIPEAAAARRGGWFKAEYVKVWSGDLQESLRRARSKKAGRPDGTFPKSSRFSSDVQWWRPHRVLEKVGDPRKLIGRNLSAEKSNCCRLKKKKKVRGLSVMYNGQLCCPLIFF